MLENMSVLKIFILICLIDEGMFQLQNSVGCSRLRQAHESLCPSEHVGLSSLHLQGTPGKRGPAGVKGEKGMEGQQGERGPDGTVDYMRVERFVMNQLKQGIPCSMGLKDNLNSRVVMSSSSPLDSRSEAASGRLDEQPTVGSTGSWCGRPEERNWIDVDFGATHLVAGVVTQGSPSSNHWVKTFKVACGNEHGQYTEYKENGKQKIFEANSDKNSKAFNIFSNVLSCRRIRIIPQSWNTKPCIRMEVLHAGCYAPIEYNFYVKSQGADDGWICRIFVNGVEKSTSKRGFCVVIFNPFTAIFKAKSFDTYGPNKVTETSQMISFLDGAVEQSVVSIAVQDTAGDPVDSTLIAKMKLLGASGVSCELSSYGHRDSFAFIGQKLRNGAERPDWVKCQHVKRHNGYAAVHANIKTSRYFIGN